MKAPQPGIVPPGNRYRLTVPGMRTRLYRTRSRMMRSLFDVLTVRRLLFSEAAFNGITLEEWHNGKWQLVILSSLTFPMPPP